jgi:broad specificity phosphatase PhoE
MLTFIRHAKTEYNNKRLFQGQLDINLSESGINETIEKSKSFPQDFDICFCSPLKRTKQTAEILVPYLSLNFDDRIKERNMGDWQGTVITDERLEQLGNNAFPPNGEKVSDIDKRVSEFLKMINDNYKDKNVLVVTHAGVIHSVGRILSNEVESAEHLELIKVEL